MRNRVTPTGDVVAIELRGAWLGNRGILHEGTDIVRFHRSELWITCTLKHKDWRLPQWAPGHFTVLFFHDEAVALAAGHRPCALCRRDDYNRYRQRWATGNGVAVPKAKELDHRLHGERLVRGSQRRRFHVSTWPLVPAGAFVMLDGQPSLVLDDGVVPWTIHGYGPAASRPANGAVELITPSSTVEALRAGYQPQIDRGATTAIATPTPTPDAAAANRTSGPPHEQ